MGAGPSRFGSSLSAVGDDDDEEPPPERLDAFPGRVDMTSPPGVPLSRDPPPWECVPDPSNDDDVPPPMENRPVVRSMSEAAAVPVAPTRHRHPKM